MNQFPVIHAKGSHYEVGRAVGEGMKGAVVRHFAKNKSTYPDYFIRYKQQTLDLLHLIQGYFLPYFEELRGLADGAGLPMEELFLSNARETSYFKESSAEHCTVIGIPSGDGYIVGHNEDWERDALEHLFVLDAEIEGIRIFGFGYDFTNTIIGDSVAINQYGIVQAINEVSHTDSRTGVPKAFIARAIMDCRTLDEAEKIIQCIPRKGGFNHLLVHGNNLWNMETSAKENAVEKLQSEKYIHTNHYVTELMRLDRGNSESAIRYKKIKDIIWKIQSIDDIKRLLSDKEEPPVCRDNTIGSMLFDIPNKIAYIAYGQPTPTTYVAYSLKHVLK